MALYNLSVESRVFPVDSILLPDQSKWPKGYLGTVVGEMLEKFNGNQPEVHRLSGVGTATIWRIHEQIEHEGYDWRSVRKKLEKRYRTKYVKKDGRGRPPKDKVYTGEGELKLSETEGEKEKPVIMSGGGAEFEAEAPQEDDEGKKKKENQYESAGKGFPGVGVQTRRPVFTFKVANHEIPIDPDMLFEMYFIYVDIQRRTGCMDDFMATLKLGIETLWELSSRQPAELLPATAMLEVYGGDEEQSEEELELVPAGG